MNLCCVLNHLFDHNEPWTCPQCGYVSVPTIDEDFRQALELVQDLGSAVRAPLPQHADGLVDAIAQAIVAFKAGHNDNTGMSCRIQLDGHDSCTICNLVGEAVRGVIEGGFP